MPMNARTRQATRTLRVLALLVACAAGCETQKLRDKASDPLKDADAGFTAMMAMEMNPMEMSTPFMLPGMTDPILDDPETTALADDAEVIGVVIDGEPRAYQVAAMRAPATHVINDVIGGRAATVTYCDRSDCVRVLGKESQTSPLTVGLGGWSQGKMSLLVNGKMVAQDATLDDLSDLAFERMPWGQWKAAHPGTVVFTNRQKEAAEEEPEPAGADAAAGEEATDNGRDTPREEE